MHTITDWLGSLSGPVVYAVVAALVFFEDTLFFGFVLPGETAVFVGGVLASQGKVSVYWLAVAVVLAAIAGDSVGYEIGHRFGPRILETRPLRRHRDRVEAAQDMIRRRGAPAVFFGRFIAFFRAMMPALAGISRMPTAGSSSSTPSAAWSGVSVSRCWAISRAPPTPGSNTRSVGSSRCSSPPS
ncbi:DedA family protein [Streptomyces sp. NPDC001594]|uniref:DedA family protein n=1 Tax=Streptomyces sp. NPDC001594 TaxID=3364590 RepID=UPI0036B0609A